MKKYNKTKTIVQNVTYKETIVPTNRYVIYGESVINLWGSGQGSITMYKTSFTHNGDLTKKVIFENSNDGGFGCESIERVVAYIEQEVKITREYTKPEKKTERIKDYVLVVDGLSIDSDDIEKE